MNKYLKFNGFIFGVAFSVLGCSLTNADPLVLSVSSGEDELVLIGESFGNKESPYPILWAFGSDVRENGQPVNKETGVVDGESVQVSTSSSSVWTRGEGVAYSSLSRIPEVSHTYRAENDGWLGWPVAFGGDDTPFSDQAYVAWRVKTPGDISHYALVAVTDSEGSFFLGKDEFSPGERVEIIPIGAEPRIGRIVHFDSDKQRMHIEVVGLSSKHFVGGKVVGLDSGASAILDSSVYYRSGSSSKYFRSYETISEGGTHFVVSTNRLITAQYDSQGNELRRAFEFDGDAGYGLPNISASTDWQLVEAYIDLSESFGHGFLRLNSNELKSFSGLDITGSKPKDAGPTISNIGWEAAGGVEEVNVAINFGEIYFDKTPQRVVLSNTQDLLSAGANVEFQFIKAWSNNEIRVEKRFGGLRKDMPIYAFVFNKNNISNKIGYCVSSCDVDELPPSKIDLSIE